MELVWKQPADSVFAFQSVMSVMLNASFCQSKTSMDLTTDAVKYKPLEETHYFDYEETDRTFAVILSTCSGDSPVIHGLRPI